jgi:hypothetical protein
MLRMVEIEGREAVKRRVLKPELIWVRLFWKYKVK